MTKKIKNNDSPLGRKDWKGRQPRWRVSLTHPQLMIIKEWADDYFLEFPEKETDLIYMDLYQRICEHIEEIQKPLTEDIISFPLFEKNFDYE